jgi:hypothetical protein
VCKAIHNLRCNDPYKKRNESYRRQIRTKQGKRALKTRSAISFVQKGENLFFVDIKYLIQHVSYYYTVEDWGHYFYKISRVSPEVIIVQEKENTYDREKHDQTHPKGYLGIFFIPFKFHLATPFSQKSSIIFILHLYTKLVNDF